MEQARFESAAGASGDFFARAIDLEVDVVLVGAPGSDGPGPLSGGAALWRMGASQTSFGAGLAGTGDLVPSVFLSSCPAANQTLEIVVENGLGGAPGILIWSDTVSSFPFAGGDILVGFPLFNSIPHFLGGTPGIGGEGTAAFPIVIDNTGVLGQTLVLQAGYLDAGSTSGFSLSAGLEILFPSP